MAPGLVGLALVVDLVRTSIVNESRTQGVYSNPLVALTLSFLRSSLVLRLGYTTYPKAYAIVCLFSS